MLYQPYFYFKAGMTYRRTNEKFYFDLKYRQVINGENKSYKSIKYGSIYKVVMPGVSRLIDGSNGKYFSCRQGCCNYDGHCGYGVQYCTNDLLNQYAESAVGSMKFYQHPEIITNYNLLDEVDNTCDTIVHNDPEPADSIINLSQLQAITSVAFYIKITSDEANQHADTHRFIHVYVKDTSTTDKAIFCGGIDLKYLNDQFLKSLYTTECYMPIVGDQIIIRYRYTSSDTYLREFEVCEMKYESIPIEYLKLDIKQIDLNMTFYTSSAIDYFNYKIVGSHGISKPLSINTAFITNQTVSYSIHAIDVLDQLYIGNFTSIQFNIIKDNIVSFIIHDIKIHYKTNDQIDGLYPEQALLGDDDYVPNNQVYHVNGSHGLGFGKVNDLYDHFGCIQSITVDNSNDHIQYDLTSQTATLSNDQLLFACLLKTIEHHGEIFNIKEVNNVMQCNIYKSATSPFNKMEFTPTKDPDCVDFYI